MPVEHHTSSQVHTPPLQDARDIHQIVTYYEDTGLDYGSWSRDYNMHFGYWRKGLSVFRREPMLEEMNKQVFQLLQITKDDQTILDMGCGLGATMRTFAREYADLSIQGVTLVPWQLQMAQKLNEAAGLEDRISLIEANYLNVPLPDGSVHAAYALESCCHSPGEDKAAFLQEMYRMLVPGGRCVIVDGYTKVPRSSFGSLFRYCIDSTCRGWALPCFPSLKPFLQRMEALGLEDIHIQDASWRIAPTAVHSPFCVAGFIFRKWWQGERLNAVRLGHLRSCLYGLFLGMSRRKFGYFIISARKPKPDPCKTEAL